MKRRETFLAGMVLVPVLLWFMCATSEGVVKPASMDCSANVNFEMATNKAQITIFKCYIKPYLNVNVLWYEVGLKNVSDKPARFLIRILPGDGSGFSGLIPQQGKPKKFPLLAPGKESINKYPINTRFDVPPELAVVIEEAFE